MKNIFRKYFPVMVLLAVGAGIITAQGVVQNTPKGPSGMAQTNGGKDFIVTNPTQQTVRQVPKLAIRSAKMSIIGAGSAIGKEGDYVMVVTGQGFLETSLNPVIHLEKLTITDTYVNADMTELYGVIPQKMLPELRKSTVAEVALQNPGGLNEDPKRWATLKVEKGQVKTWLEGAQPVVFVRGKYAIEMRK